jgi:hypothetical protein
MVRVFVLILPLALLLGTLALFAEEGPSQAPPAKQHKQVVVSSKTLDRYVGRYSMPGGIMKITRENSHLFMQANDEPRKEIFAESEFQFFSRISSDLITFEGISGGKAIIMMIHSEDGKSTPLARID